MRYTDAPKITTEDASYSVQFNDALNKFPVDSGGVTYLVRLDDGQVNSRQGYTRLILVQWTQ